MEPTSTSMFLMESFYCRCSGNGAPDADEFMSWALTQPGAPAAGSPEVWAYLLTALDAVEADESES